MFKRAKVVMLPTNEKAQIVLFDGAKKLFLLDSDKTNFQSSIPFKYQHLYILSDEPIKEGDWVILLDSIGNVFSNPQQYNDPKTQHLNDGLKKIIASTDTNLKVNEYLIAKYVTSEYLPQPSDSFIQKYVSEYNKGNIIEEVMVEYEDTTPKFIPIDKFNSDDLTDYIKLKINPKDNTITIRKLKDSWNREEVIEFAEKYARMVQEKPIQLNAYKRIHNQKWIDENL